MLLKRQVEICVYFLKWLTETFPTQARSQNRMSFELKLPRLFECGYIHSLSKNEHDLPHIHGLMRNVERVEEHPSLKRRGDVRVFQTDEPVRSFVSER